ncbi:MAG: DNA-binding protein [Bacteroidetes bacterium]|jgi:predicted nucleic acid-binding protein|nr:DNA-binding protein [Bacteroidota bacterium]
MATSERVVVDANILFSALLRPDSPFTRHIVHAPLTFFVCESAIVSLFKHKERIVALSRLSEDEVVRQFYLLLRRVTVSNEELIDLAARRQALTLCRDVDPDDTPHVALTLSLDGLLWTGDEALKRGLRTQGFDRFYDPA